MLLSERTSLRKIGFHWRVNSVTGSGHWIFSLSLYSLLDQLVMIQLSGSVILLSSNEVIHREKRERKAETVTACVMKDKNTVKLLKSLENCYPSSYSDSWKLTQMKKISFMLIKVFYFNAWLFTAFLCFNFQGLLFSKKGMWRPSFSPTAISIKYVLCVKKTTCEPNKKNLTFSSNHQFTKMNSHSCNLYALPQQYTKILESKIKITSVIQQTTEPDVF